MSPERIVKLLSRYRFEAHNEAVLKEAIAMVLRENGIPFRREVKLGDTTIPFLCGSIGIECKLRGSALAFAHRVSRYEAEAEVLGMVLVVDTIRVAEAASRWLPLSFAKPVHTLVLRTR